MVQMRLTELGYYTGTVTGGYYGGTIEAVMPAIGIVSPCVTRRPSSVARTRKPANGPTAATVAMNCRLLVILSHNFYFPYPR